MPIHDSLVALAAAALNSTSGTCNCHVGTSACHTPQITVSSTPDYNLLCPVGEEALNPFLGHASDAIELQFQQESLVWDLVEGLREVQEGHVCLAALVDFSYNHMLGHVPSRSVAFCRNASCGNCVGHQ